MTPVVITGIGVVSPLGCSVGEIAHRFAAGERAQPTGQTDDSAFAVADIPLTVVPADKRTHIGRLDRFCRLLLTASYLAVDEARLPIVAGEADRIGLSFGTGLGCLLTNAEYNLKVVDGGPAAASPRLFAYTVSSAPAGEVSIALGIKGPNVTAHMGLAAGLGAVGYGFDLIQMGHADVVLAGGADAAGPALTQALADMQLLKSAEHAEPFRDAAPGVCPSEGAAVVVLERLDRARHRGAPVWGRIDGYAAGFEPTLTHREPTPRGLTATVERALRTAGRSAADIGAVYASAHGTPIDEVERAGLIGALGAGSRALLFAPKVAFGEAFGASGVLALALAAGLGRQGAPLADGLAYDLRAQTIPGAEAAHRLRQVEVVMLHALCYSGNVASLVLRRDA